MTLMGKKMTTWTSTILDADDGTGAGIIELPDDLRAELGWKVGDKLEIEVLLDGKIRVSRTPAEAF